MEQCGVSQQLKWIVAIDSACNIVEVREHLYGYKLLQ
jgi:hypothetical protein